jgi:hypothetical protein
MKKLFNFVSVLVLVIALIPACDIIEEPYLVPVDDDGPGPGDEVRKVLLEDYTGQKCPNCPSAAEVAHNLQAIYGEQLILLTIHAGVYSTPDATGDFTADFRTAEGNDLNAYFGFPGYPMGLVNRAEYGGMRILVKDSWETAVDAQLEMDADAAVKITNTYNTGTRKLDCKLETEFLEEMEGTFNICAFIVESGIISPQQTQSGVNQTYEHNHVLRTSMNGTWGDPVGNDGLAVTGTVLTNNYSFSIPSEWNAENCAVIAFVYDSETLVVIQAEEEGF